ncbi:MAG TPA: DUF998 domain-containing protein [Patescibacteria group bacterium]|nr:DUF998 domain-containing protein [Patescibacteria group bacterium]
MAYSTISRIGKWFWSPYHLSIVGIVAYNSWILALVLNPQATFSGATTSELEVNGQPWALLFRIADIVAGTFLLLGMEAIVSLGINVWQRWVLRFGMFILGASTIFEVFVPLGCSSAANQVCARQEDLGLAGWQSSLHICESVATYILIFLAPFTVGWAVRAKPGLSRLRNLSWILAAGMVVWGIETAIKFVNDSEAYGYEQRLFLILFTVWFAVCLNVYHKHEQT